MALATGEAVSNTPSIPAAIADTYSDKGEFAQRPPNTGATAPTLTSRRPRFIQAINERPLIAAVPIGHTDRPAVLSSAPGIPLPATPATPASPSNPTDDAPAADASIASATEPPAPVASAEKRPPPSNHVRRRGRSEYARQIMLIIIINRDRTTKALTRADTLEFGDASANNRETFFCGLIRMGDQAPKPISILYPDAEKCPVCLSRRPLPLLPVHQGNSLARDGLVPNQLDASNQPLSPVNRPGILAL